MNQLTLEDLIQFVENCKRVKTPLNTPIYLGNDDELNGVHCAWYIETVKKEEEVDENVDFILEMIDDRFGNNTSQDINILIS